MSTRTLTTQQAAERVGVTYQHMRSMCARGKGPTTEHREGAGANGGTRHFTIEEIDRWDATRRKLLANRRTQRVTTPAA